MTVARADVRQRRRAAAQARARRRPQCSKPRRRRSAADDIGTREPTCGSRGGSGADGEPHRSAQGPARAAGGGRASSSADGIDVALDIVGPTIGLIGDDERDAIRARGRRASAWPIACTCSVPVPLDQLMTLYRDYDFFVLPTQPGEGIPRVLLEAMANGLPIVTTDVSGIGSLITQRARTAC